MKYRPEGWNRKRNEYLNKNTILALSVENIATYEAGADAMLEGLIKEGEHLEWDKEVVTVKAPNVFRKKFKGTFVFIPEEG